MLARQSAWLPDDQTFTCRSPRACRRGRGVIRCRVSSG